MAPTNEEQKLATWPEAELDEAALVEALEKARRDQFAELAGL